MKRTLVVATALFAIAQTPLLAFDVGSVLESASDMSRVASEQQNSSLVDLLTSKLGVTTTQASGGAAALLNKGASNMSTNDASQLEKVPGLAGLMSSSAISSSLAGTSLGKQFEALGLDQEMIEEYTPIVLEYVKEHGGTALSYALKAAL